MLSQVFYQTAQDNSSIDGTSVSHEHSQDEATKPKTSRKKRFKSSLFKALATIIKGSANSSPSASTTVPTTDAGSEEAIRTEPATDADFECVFV